MSLHAIARELDAVLADLRHLEERLPAHAAGDAEVAATWSAAHEAAQVDALHVRLDAVTAEIRAFEALARRSAAPAFTAAG